MKVKKFGAIAGYAFTFLIFSILLYFILKFSEKLPAEWGYLHVFLISISIASVGRLIKLLLV
ncbi:hypothetical protein A3K73_05705 [Candidatus Pacearchaeota archaeon RBG_13_36_9]|nr:MAG: hypothetical protein A3K73_05705 [Candidatus Pacearchaeota archaeon RBG_13_36_9]